MNKLKLFLFFLLATFFAHAQTPQFLKGGGTTSNGIPFNSTTVLKSQSLYTAAELGSATAGYITRVYFRSSAVSSTATFTNFNINLGQTSATGFASSGTLFFTGLTNVYSAPTVTLTTNAVAGSGGTGGWFYVDIPSPYFLYDPAQRLIVEISFASKSAGGFTVFTTTTGAAPNNKRITATTLAATLGTTVTSWPDFGIDVIPPVSCATPADQATALNLTPVSSSQINVSYTAAASTPSGYLVVRYPNLAATTNPVDATAYTAGASLGLGTVVYNGTGTSFNNTGLTGGTTYDYYVYTYNNTSCAGGPKYNTTTPLTGSATTNSCSALTGTFTVGPTGTYASLTSAMTDISNNGLGGPIVLELQAAYASTVETFPITFPTNACVTSVKTITIRPELSATNLSIVNNAATPTLDFNGGSNVLIDGRPGGIGSTGQLLISNTTISAPAVTMANDATNNTITYCELTSNNAGIAGAAGAGIVNIGGTTGITGNDNNTFSYCNVHNAAGANPTVAFNINGSTGSATLNNDNISITNCDIYDYFSATLGYTGVYFGTGTNASTISNNKFYQTLARTITGTATNRDLHINNPTGNTSGSGFTVNNNFFGGNSSAGTGVYTLTGTTTHLYNSAVIAVGTGTTTQVQGNTFTNMSMTSASLSAAAFSCLFVSAGTVDIGTTTSNLIGVANTDASVSPAITFTNTGVSAGGFIPLFASSGTLNVTNNIIAGIRLVGSVTSNVDFSAIAVNNGNINITNNTIGSANTPKSIFYATTGSTSGGTSRFNGILLSVTGAFGTTNITGNTIANMQCNNDAITGNNTARGISMIGTFSAGTNAFNISNNIIRDITTASGNGSTGASAALIGIALGTSGSSGTYTINGNSIYNLGLTNTSTTLALQVTGITFNGTPSSAITNNLITKNIIHSLGVTAVNTNAFINGIEILAGSATYANNMIRLGIDGAGNSISTALVIRGINKTSTLVNNFYFNSLYIGGTGVGTTVKNSGAFIKTSTGNDDIRNNIFVNNRANATTGGKHYQLQLINNSGINLNYNNYFGTGAGTVFALNLAADVAGYTLNWIAGDGNSKNYDPNYMNPTGDASTVDLHINAVPASPIESTGTPIALITDDIDGQLRSGLTPTDMGADALNAISLFICSSANNLGTVSASPTSVCEGTTSTLSLIGYDFNITGITYQWKSSTVSGGPYTNVVGGSGETTPVYTTPALTNGTYYYVLERTCSNCGPCSITSAEVSVQAYTITPPSSISTSQCGPGIPTVSVATTGVGSGQYYWYSAASAGNLLQGPTMQTYYSNDFSSATLTNSSITGNATISGGDLKLHPNAVSQYGAFTVNASGINSSRYQVDFDLTTIGTPTNMADGLSYSFSDDGVSTAEAGMNAENGTGTKLKVAFVEYGAGLEGIYLMYNCTTNEQTSVTSGVLAYSNNLTWRGTTNHITLIIDDFGKATLKLGATTIFNNVQLPAGYLSANRATWKHIIKSRSGGISSGTTVDNVVIQTESSAPGYTTYLTPITTTTTFYVSEKGTNGCYSGRTAVTATVVTPPTVTATPLNTTVCEGYPVTLTGGGTATSFTWSPSVPDATPFPATTSTTYTVTGSDGTCTNTATAVVVVNPVMTGTVSATPAAFCLGGTAQLDAAVASICPPSNISGFTGFYAPASWTFAGNGGSNNFAGAPANIQLTTSTANLGNNSVTSLTRTLTCTGSGTVTFNWTFTHPDVGVFHQPRYKKNATVTVFPSYNQGAGAGTQSGTISIPVVAGDVISLEAFTQDDSQPATLTVSNFSAPPGQETGTVTYWTLPSGGTNLGAPPINVTPTTSGANLYYAEFTVTTSGCVNLVRTPVTVTANALPAVTSTPSAASACINSQVTLAGDGAGSNASYVWSGGITDNTPFTATILGPTTYTVTGTDLNTTCSNTATVVVTVNDLPIITATPSMSEACIGKDATLAGGGGLPGSYTWSGGITDNTPFTTVVLGQTTYTVTGTDANTCSNTATAVVNVNDLPLITATPSSATVCQNAQLTLTGGGAGLGGGYVWSGSVVDATPFTMLSAGPTETYTVTGTDANTCSNTTSITININPIPTVTASASLSSTCENTTVIFTGGGAGIGASYTWDNGVTDGLPKVVTANNFYTVTGTDANTCTGIASVLVGVNAASPDLSNATSGNTSSVAGLNSDTDDQIANSFISYYSGSCNLIASINSTAALGLTTVTVNVDNNVNTHNGQPYLERWFQIEPTTNTGTGIIFYLTQADFDTYNVYATSNGWPLLPTGPSDAAGIARLRVTKNDNAGLGINPVVITPNNVVWNAATSYWEINVSVTSLSQFHFHAENPNNVPLPAVITNFEGKKSASSNILDWTTSSEQNCAYFNLQYSTDGNQFTTIGRINSKSVNGLSQQVLDYTFNHTSPAAGHNYYRLEQVDLDGKASLNSQVIDLMWSSNGTVVTLYPNPIQHNLQIDLFAAKAQNTNINIVDMSGRTLKQVQLKSVQGANHFEVNLDEIASGLYFVQIYENDKLVSVSKVKKN
ncbi:MAG: T9SS type A sorting domain-containing protein [Chitinophagaceae bacterium]|nr:T9SS type A sorting domain-containing protein [Chitinophagaceae bacterium]